MENFSLIKIKKKYLRNTKPTVNRERGKKTVTLKCKTFIENSVNGDDNFDNKNWRERPQ